MSVAEKINKKIIQPEKKEIVQPLSQVFGGEV